MAFQVDIMIEHYKKVWSGKHHIILPAILVAINICCMVSSSDAMGDSPANKEPQKYEKNGKIFMRDYIYWDEHAWFRYIYEVDSTPDDIAKAFGNLDAKITKPPFEDYIHYYRKDLVYYVDGISFYLNKQVFVVAKYRRKQDDKIIVTDKDLEKPYIQLAEFTCGGRVPSNWKKVKKKIQRIGSGTGADAVIVKKAEVKQFRKEDYMPITEFQHPEYVLYTCTAVVYEDNAVIPPYKKVFVTDKDYPFPYEVIDEFSIDYKGTSNYDFQQYLRKVVYERYKADGVRIVKREEIRKKGLFSKGITRYYCQALRFPDKIKEQFVIHPDTDIDALMKQKVQY